MCHAQLPGSLLKAWEDFTEKAIPTQHAVDFFRLDRDLFLFGEGFNDPIHPGRLIIDDEEAETAGSRLGSDGKVCRARGQITTGMIVNQDLKALLCPLEENRNCVRGSAGNHFDTI